MKDWITDPDVKPSVKQPILATLMEHGEPKVVACWYIEDNRIKLDQNPGTQTYAFARVKAWQPFPKPYIEFVKSTP